MPTTTRYTYHYDKGPPASGLGGRGRGRGGLATGGGYASQYMHTQKKIGGGPPALRSSLLHVSAQNSAFVGDVRKVPPPTMRATRADDGWAATHPDLQIGGEEGEAAYMFEEGDRWPRNEAASSGYIDDDDDSKDLGATPTYPPPPLRVPTADHYTITTTTTEDAYYKNNSITNYQNSRSNGSHASLAPSLQHPYPPHYTYHDDRHRHDHYYATSGGGELSSFSPSPSSPSSGAIIVGAFAEEEEGKEAFRYTNGGDVAGRAYADYADYAPAAVEQEYHDSTSPSYRYTPRGVYDNDDYEEKEGDIAGHHVVHNNNSIPNQYHYYRHPDRPPREDDANRYTYAHGGYDTAAHLVLPHHPTTHAFTYTPTNAYAHAYALAAHSPAHAIDNKGTIMPPFVNTLGGGGGGDVHYGEPHDAYTMYTHSDLNEEDNEEVVAVIPIYSPSMAPYEEDREILKRERGSQLLASNGSRGSGGSNTRLLANNAAATTNMSQYEPHTITTVGLPTAGGPQTAFALPLNPMTSHVQQPPADNYQGVDVLLPHHQELPTVHNMLYSSYHFPYPHHHEEQPTADAIQSNHGLNDTAPLTRIAANTVNLLNESDNHPHPNPNLLAHLRLHPHLTHRPTCPSLAVSGAMTGSSWLTREAAVVSTLDAYTDFFTKGSRAGAPFLSTTQQGSHLGHHTNERVEEEETEEEVEVEGEEEEEVEIEHIHIHHVHHISGSGHGAGGDDLNRQQPAIRSSSSSSRSRIIMSQKRGATNALVAKTDRREGAERNDGNELKGQPKMKAGEDLVVAEGNRQTEGRERSSAIKAIPDHLKSPQKAIYTANSEGSFVSTPLPPLMLVEYADPNFLPVVIAPLPISQREHQHEHQHHGVFNPDGAANVDDEEERRGGAPSIIEERPPLLHQPSPSSIHITPAHLEHTMRYEHTTIDSGPPLSTDDGHLSAEETVIKAKEKPEDIGRSNHGNDLTNRVALSPNSTLYHHQRHLTLTEGSGDNHDVSGLPRSGNTNVDKRRRSLIQEKGAEERLLDHLEALIGQSKTYRKAVGEGKGVAGGVLTGDACGDGGTVASTRSSSATTVNCSSISAIPQQSSRHLPDTSISAPDTPLRSRGASTQSLGTLSKQPLGGVERAAAMLNSGHSTNKVNNQNVVDSSIPYDVHFGVEPLPRRLRSRHLLLMSPYTGREGKDEEEGTIDAHHIKKRPPLDDEDYFDVTNLGYGGHNITSDAHTNASSSLLVPPPPQYWYDPPLSRYVTIPDLLYERASSRAASSSAGAPLHVSRGTSRSHSACHSSVHGEQHIYVRSTSNSNNNSYHSSGQGRRRLLSPQLPRRGGEVVVVINRRGANTQEGGEDERDRHDRTTAAARPPLALRSVCVGTHEKSSHEAEALEPNTRTAEKKSADLLRNTTNSLGIAANRSSQQTSWTTPSPRRRRGSGSYDLSALMADDPRFSPEQERILDKRRDNTEDAVSRVLEMFGTNDACMGVSMIGGDSAEPPLPLPPIEMTLHTSSSYYPTRVERGGAADRMTNATTSHPVLTKAGSGASPSPPRSLYRRRFAVRL